MVNSGTSGSLYCLVFLALLLSVSALLSSAEDGEQASKPPALDAVMRTEVVTKVGELMVKFYIFPDKASISLITKKLQAGEYDKIKIGRAHV